MRQPTLVHWIRRSRSSRHCPPLQHPSPPLQRPRPGQQEEVPECCLAPGHPVQSCLTFRARGARQRGWQPRPPLGACPRSKSSSRRRPVLGYLPKHPPSPAVLRPPGARSFSADRWQPRHSCADGTVLEIGSPRRRLHSGHPRSSPRRCRPRPSSSHPSRRRRHRSLRAGQRREE